MGGGGSMIGVYCTTLMCIFPHGIIHVLFGNINEPFRCKWNSGNACFAPL
jgi:hypothetical protein